MYICNVCNVDLNLPMVHEVVLFFNEFGQARNRKSEGAFKPPIKQPSVNAVQPWPLWKSSPGGIRNNFSNIQQHSHLPCPICSTEMTLGKLPLLLYSRD